jgi:diguanylate cyclase (GGDEF)-like protein
VLAQGDGANFQDYYVLMATLNEHLIKLTDHRERDLLELTLSKALIDLLSVQRVIIARVITDEGVSRWLDVATLDARGGGKVVDPLRVDFNSLPLVEDSKQRLTCVQGRVPVVFAWAGEDGPRITYLPLFDALRADGDGVVEIHSAAVLNDEQMQAIDSLLHVFRNMYSLLAYSDRDGLTGLLNRRALENTFYSAVLEELDIEQGGDPAARDAKLDKAQERRHRVPPNYWLGTVRVDAFADIGEQHGALAAEEVLLMVARVINNTFRTYDRLYRLGGDQFAVLMHCPDEALVLAAFERFRANIDKFIFPQAGHASVCCSFAKVTPDDTPQTSVLRVERAVAYAQAQGGNRVFSYPELVRTGVLDPELKAELADA